MSKRARKNRVRVADEDTVAVLFRKRTVNTYSKACPRQVMKKHNFLTPETPVVDTIELPSRVLRDGSTITSSTYSSQPVSRLDNLNDDCTRTQSIPLTNLDTVSMDLTCLANGTNFTTTGTARERISLGDKLNYLKQTLSCELHRMKDPITTNSTTDPYTSRFSTPTLVAAASVETPGTQSGLDRGQGKLEQEREREEKEGKMEEIADRDDSIGKEVPSVSLMSCDNSRETSSNNNSHAKNTHDKIAKDDRGKEENEEMREEEESEIEMARAADENFISHLSHEAAEPLPISPDMTVPPELSVSNGLKRKRISIDLEGLCGVSPSNVRESGKGGVDNRRKKREALRVQSSSKRSSSQPVRRKTRRKKMELSSGTTPSHFLDESDKVEKTNDKETAEKMEEEREQAIEFCSPKILLQSASSHEHSLEQHFNQLQITPILPHQITPSHPHQITKSTTKPLTSTPIQLDHTDQQSLSLETNIRPQVYPLTSTPLLNDHTHHPPNPAPNLTDITTGDKIVESIQMGSTTERLQDYDPIPYEASTAFDISSLLPCFNSQLAGSCTTSRQAGPSDHHCKSKTLLSIAWDKNRTKLNQSEPKLTTTPPTIRHSGTTQRPKSRQKIICKRKSSHHPDKTRAKITTPTTIPLPNETKPTTKKHTMDHNKPSIATKRSQRRRTVIPPGLQRPKKPKTTTRNILTPTPPTHKLTPSPLSHNLTPKNLPECILTLHTTSGDENKRGILATNLHYSAPDTSLDDILTHKIISV